MFAPFAHNIVGGFCKGFEDESEIFTHFGMELKGRKHLTTEQC